MKKSGWSGWNIFENNPFIEVAEWMDSSDGELFDEVRAHLAVIENVAGCRRSSSSGKMANGCPSTSPCNITQTMGISARSDRIQGHCMAGNGVCPESYSQEQLHELDR
jgi:hypothetical protein